MRAHWRRAGATDRGRHVPFAVHGRLSKESSENLHRQGWVRQVRLSHSVRRRRLQLPSAARLARRLLARDEIHSARKGEAAWPPLAGFKGLLISVWYDLSDMKLAEALEDRACFAGSPATPMWSVSAGQQPLVLLTAQQRYVDHAKRVQHYRLTDITDFQSISSGESYSTAVYFLSGQ